MMSRRSVFSSVRWPALSLAGPGVALNRHQPQNRVEHRGFDLFPVPASVDVKFSDVFKDVLANLGHLRRRVLWVFDPRNLLKQLPDHCAEGQQVGVNVRFHRDNPQLCADVVQVPGPGILRGKKLKTRRADRGLNPAKSIIKKLGGEKVVSQITGTSYTAPYRWQHPVAKGGTGGAIPQKHIPALMAHARQVQVALEASEFFATESSATIPAAPS